MEGKKKREFGEFKSTTLVDPKSGITMIKKCYY